MLNAYLPLMGGALIVLGLIGMLTKRNLISIALAAQVVFLGAVLIIAPFLANDKDNALVRIILVIALLIGLQCITLGGVAIFAYRHRGSLQIDELRQLEG